MSISNTLSYSKIIQSHLPPIVTNITELFCKVHQFWKGAQRAQEISQSATNFGLSCAGWILNLCLGDKPFIQLTARGIYIARKIVDCVKAQKIFAQKYEQFINAYNEEIYEPKCWIFDKGFCFLSASCNASLKHSLNASIERIVNVVSQAFSFIGSLFTFTMHFTSLIQAFSISEEIRQETVKDIFLNAKALVKELKDHEKEVHAILFSMGAEYHVSFLTDTASAGVTCLGTLDDLFERITSSLKDFFTPSKKLDFFTPPLSIPKIPLREYHP